MSNLVIVCAAVRLDDGRIILGSRHFDQFMKVTLILMCKNQAAYDRLLKHHKQGFIDQFGRFYDRQEAWVIASKAGQIKRRVGGDDAEGGTLYSENLY